MLVDGSTYFFALSKTTFFDTTVIITVRPHYLRDLKRSDDIESITHYNYSTTTLSIAYKKITTRHVATVTIECVY